MNVTLRYGWGALRGDLIRAGFGLLCAGYAAHLGGWLESIVGIVMTVVAGLFVAFGLRTLWRRTQVYELTDRGVRRSNILLNKDGGAVLAWEDVVKVSLRFYSTRRDRSNGWMQLTCKGRGGGPKVSVESTIDQFDALAEAAARCIARHGAAANGTSRSNFLALGVDLPEAASIDAPDFPPDAADADDRDEKGHRP